MSNELAVQWQRTNCWKEIKWMGRSIFKNPCDLVIMQEILDDCKPSLIIECGTNQGGSGIFFMSILRDLLNLESRLATVEINRSHVDFGKYNSHVTFFHGSSTDLEIFENAIIP